MMDVLPHEKQIFEYLKTIDHLKQQNEEQPLFGSEIRKLEEKLDKLKKKVYGELTPWERVMICRHPQRPHAIDYIEKMCDSFQELCGDRLYGNDQAVVGGLATIGGKRCVVIGQEKGNDTDSRVQRNFGMPSPEGYRKALRLMKLAEKFSLPVVTLLDTPGAFPGLDSEERGQGWAIAENLKQMSLLKTPIIVIVIGEGCSGGALGMGVGDVVGMLEHAYYSVISPEGCASILWKDSSRREEAAGMLKLNSENLVEFGVVDDVIPEPLGGAHHNPEAVYSAVKRFVSDQVDLFERISTELLLEKRYQKFRKMGKWEEKS